MSGSTPSILILGLREYSQKYYTTFAGVLPQKWYSASGSTPVLNKCGPVPLLQEHSHKSGIVLPGVLPNKLNLYTGSDLDMICNLDILLPLDTLGALSVLLFFVSGSSPNRLIFCQWEYLLYMLLGRGGVLGLGNGSGSWVKKRLMGILAVTGYGSV